ncbi:MAG: YcxB family protein [Clostridiaceae bacterium]|nr:YcxB family protein [Clostridiaceae bacterium]
MELPFENITVLDEQAWRAATTASFVLFGRKNTRILSFVLYLAGLVAVILPLSRGNTDGELIGFQIFAAVAYGLFVVFFWRRSERKIIRRMTKTNMKNAAAIGLEMRFTFGKDAFTTDDGSSYSVHKYSVLTALTETKDYFILFQGKVLCFILSKTAFPDDGVAHFRTFICEKCRLPLRMVKM